MRSSDFSRSLDRSFSVRVFDVLVRSCVATLDAAALVAVRFNVRDLGPIALAARPAMAVRVRQPAVRSASPVAVPAISA